MTIREAEPADMAAIANLAGQLGYPSSAQEIAMRLAALARPEHAFFVAVDEEAVVGFIHMSAVASVVSDPLAQIRALVVAETHRSRGIGARLVAAGESWASDQGLTRLRVHTNVTRERTHRFYEALGYTLQKTSRIYEK